MTQADDTILEFFEEHTIALPPSAVAYNVDFSTTHVRNRMRKLADEGLLKKVDEKKGYYEITDRGRSYLAGDLDASDLEDSLNDN
jgi:predicted transcriptional regulator